jgi:hypothetical protein
MAADVWADIYPWIVAGLGGFFGAALLLPTKLGDALFNYRIGKALEGFKGDQNRELERLKEQLSHLGDRGKRSNEMEFSAIKLVWENFVEAFLATNRCIAQMIDIPDFRAMDDEEFETFLTTIDFSENQKRQLRKAPDRPKTYGDIITWRSIVAAQHENFDTRLLLRKQGIFMPSALKDEFTKALDILVGAQIEQQIDHQHRQSGIGWKKRSDLLDKGEAMFAALGAAANQRLFREERAADPP